MRRADVASTVAEGAYRAPQSPGGSVRPERALRAVRAVRAGAPCGRRVDPTVANFWVIDRQRGTAQMERGQTLQGAYTLLRSLLAHRDPWDPWVERLHVVVNEPPQARCRRRKGDRPEVPPPASREIVDPVLVSWEVQGRLARLGWTSNRLAVRAGVSRAVITFATRGHGVAAATLAHIRANLREVETYRGFTRGD